MTAAAISPSACAALTSFFRTYGSTVQAPVGESQIQTALVIRDAAALLSMPLMRPCASRAFGLHSGMEMMVAMERMGKKGTQEATARMVNWALYTAREKIPAMDPTPSFIWEALAAMVVVGRAVAPGPGEVVEMEGLKMEEAVG